MRNPEQTRQTIIEEAAVLFNKMGYVGTSMGLLVEKIPFTKGAIYKHFANKSELASAAFDHNAKRMMDMLRVEIRRAENAPDKLRSMVDYYVNFVHKPPIEGGCPIINTSVDTMDLGNKGDHQFLREKVNGIIEIMRMSIQKITQRGIQEGQIKADLDVEGFSALFFAAIEGGILLARVQGSEHNYRLVKRQLEIIIKSIEIG
ncbi:MAG: TetR/AcrR family transcriptional regulator [Bacteroidota bacterium]